jgi:hypothetical protein
MKKYLVSGIIICLLIIFTGCGGGPHVSLREVTVTQESGMIKELGILIENYGSSTEDDLDFYVIYSLDPDIHIGGNYTIIYYEESFSIEAGGWYNRTIYWDDIEDYIVSNKISISEIEGSIGVIIATATFLSGDYEGYTGYGGETVFVPSYDSNEPNDNYLEGTSVLVGSYYDTALCPGTDQDWFKFYADEAESYYIITEKIGRTSTNTFLELYDTPTENPIRSETSGAYGDFAEIEEWVPPVSGNYYIRVSGEDSVSGIYRIYVVTDR